MGRRFWNITKGEKARDSTRQRYSDLNVSLIDSFVVGGGEGTEEGEQKVTFQMHSKTLLRKGECQWI